MVPRSKSCSILLFQRGEWFLVLIPSSTFFRFEYFSERSLQDLVYCTQEKISHTFSKNRAIKVLSQFWWNLEDNPFFRNLPRLKNFLWHIYSKTLPLYKGNHPLALCDHCSKPELTVRLFFECERTFHIIELVRSYWEDWLGLPLIWSPSSILPLKSHKHQHMFLVLVACILWTIWTCRNLSKINSIPPNSTQIVHTFKIEMARFLTAEYNVQRESYLAKLLKYPPTSLSSQALNSFFPLIYLSSPL
jgi:hypothetical protein